VARYFKLLRQVRVILVRLLKRLAKSSIEYKVCQSKVLGDPAKTVHDLFVVLRQFGLKDLFKCFLKVIVATEKTRKVFNAVLKHQLAP
jgi:hypothetical protein